jgi:hypothetical protein
VNLKSGAKISVKKDNGSCTARYGRFGEPSLPIFFEKTKRPRLHLSGENIKSRLDKKFHTGILIP